jgi:hypothetical protein
MKINHIILIVSVFVSFTLGAQVNKKQLTGTHWTGNCLGMNCDTMEFVAQKKYKEKFYQWGAYLEGKEFKKDGTVQKYYNIFCITESNPKETSTSTWRWDGERLIIDSDQRTEIYEVILLTRKKKLLKLVHYKGKENNSKEELKLLQKKFMDKKIEEK